MEWLPNQPDTAEYVKRNMSAEQAGYETTHSYVRQLDEEYGGYPFANKAFVYAIRLEPTDPALGQDETYPKCQAFYNGCLLGMRAAENILGKSAPDDLDKVNLGFQGKKLYEEGWQEEADETAERVRALGEESYNLRPDYHDFIESLEDDISQIKDAMFVRYGFGYVMHCVDVVEDHRELVDQNRVIQQIEQREFGNHTAAQEADLGLDWDAGLRQLMEEGWQE